jgi:hypothetical protein
LKKRVNAPVLAFVGEASLGLFWTLVWALIYDHVVHVPVSSLVSSFRHERVATIGNIYMMDAYASFNVVELIK